MSGHEASEASQAIAAFVERVESLRLKDSGRAAIASLARHVARTIGLESPPAFDHDLVHPPLDAICSEFHDGLLGPDLMGSTWEHLLSAGARRRQGAHFTPRAVAERVVALALVDTPDVGSIPRSIWDPAAGGGAFLLAAARFEHSERSVPRDEIVRQLHATDIDQTSLDVCDSALWIWSGGSARPATWCCDAVLDLPEHWPQDFGAIVGNPPFLGQLSADTTRGRDRQARLQAIYPEVTQAYLDEAGLFVELGLGRLRVGGVLGLVLPQSILGARDAEAVRRSALRQADLRVLWVDEGQSFDAAVDVCAPVLAKRPVASTPWEEAEQGETAVMRGDHDLGSIVAPSSTSWAPLLAFALGVPSVALGDDAGTLGERSTVTAGFRQHFYGIAGAVVDDTPASNGRPRLVTAGAIEPLASNWGRTAVRFGGRGWLAPTLDLSAIEDDKVRQWFAARCVPKLLLASQTRVIEVVVDDAAEMVPSVPVVSVEPIDESEIWHLAAALGAPAISAWMLSTAAGTGLSHDAIRVRARTLADVPLPVPSKAWDSGAEHARAASEAHDAGDDAAYVEHLRSLATTMNAAYGVSDDVGRWWWERLRLPAGFTEDAY
ncbi:MAG: hypothetical protein ACI81L_000011 [Verrucomicrobiales bacterium]|jgi:hypothetical protein